MVGWSVVVPPRFSFLLVAQARAEPSLGLSLLFRSVAHPHAPHQRRLLLLPLPASSDFLVFIFFPHFGSIIANGFLFFVLF